jgi:hypothetical protein
MNDWMELLSHPFSSNENFILKIPFVFFPWEKNKNIYSNIHQEIFHLNKSEFTCRVKPKALGALLD